MRRTSIHRYTYDIFMQRATAKYGTKYDYSKVPKEVSALSKISIKCNDCATEKEISVNSHLNPATQGGCKLCIGIPQINLELFINKSRENHGYEFDYSLIQEHEVVNKNSKVPIKCKKCNYVWRCRIAVHLVKHTLAKSRIYGCPKCHKHSIWTWERFKLECAEPDRSNWDYTLNNPGMINYSDSTIILKCKKCENISTSSLSEHFRKIRVCKVCRKNYWY